MTAGIATACGGGNENGEDNSPSPTESLDAEILDRAIGGQIGDHLGTAGESLWDARVTNEDYLQMLQKHAGQFRAHGLQLPLELEPTSSIDVGGAWSNELQLSAIVAEGSTAALIDRVRSDTGDDNVESGIAAFGSRRVLDVEASNNFGAPLLAYSDTVILFPELQMPTFPSTTPSPPPSLTPDPSLPPPGRPTTLYVVSAEGTQTISIPEPPPDVRVDDYLTPRQEMATSFLHHLVGQGDGGEAEYTPISETGVDIEGRPGYLYTEAVLEDQPSPDPPTSTSSQADVVIGAPHVTGIQRAFGGVGQFQTGRQALNGQPPDDPFGAGTRFGPPNLMPLGFAQFCGDKPSIASCQTCCDFTSGGALSVIFSGCVACLKYGVPAVAAACGLFWFICGAAAALICVGVAAGLSYFVGIQRDAAKGACLIGFTP
jgi:hypothetical protein